MLTSCLLLRSNGTLYRGVVRSLSIVCFLFGFMQSSMAAEYEQPTDITAETILKPGQIKGDYHSVDARVQYDGMFYHFTVNSPFGTFRANSITALNILIHELGAIAVMKNVKTDDTAVQSIEQTGEKTVTGLKNLITRPVSTLGGAAEGVGDLFGRAADTVGRRETTETEDSKFAQVVGFTKSKGQIATKFGVSIYSRNSVLQDELDRLAMADYLGGISVGLATSVVPGVGGLVLTTSGTARLLNEVINNTPASKLWVQNKDKLISMGLDTDTVELFLNNPVFTPALETVMVNALDAMETVNNRGMFVKIGLQAANPDMAGFITEIAVLSAGYHKNIAPLKGLARMGRLVKGIREDGTTVVILPTDHLIWSERVAGVVTDLTAANLGRRTGYELWVLGTLSKKTKSELQTKGWLLQENVAGKLISYDPSSTSSKSN
jgi:hypothetical protein